MSGIIPRSLKGPVVTMNRETLAISIASCAARLQRLVELEAPDVIIEMELRLIERRVAGFVTSAAAKEYADELERRDA